MCISFGECEEIEAQKDEFTWPKSLSVAQLGVESRCLIPKVVLLPTNQELDTSSVGFALERTPVSRRQGWRWGETSHPDMGSCYSLGSDWRKHLAQPVAALAAHLSHSPGGPLG